MKNLRYYLKKLKRLLKAYNMSNKNIISLVFILFIFGFITSCSEESVIYSEVEISEDTVRTFSLPSNRSKVFQSFPKVGIDSKLYFGEVKGNKNRFSLLQLTLFSGNLPPTEMSDLLADSIQIDSAMVYFETSDSLDLANFSLHAILTDQESIFDEDSTNYYNLDEYYDFENNSLQISEAIINSENILAPDTTGFDTLKFMIQDENLETFKENFLDTSSNPARTLMIREDGHFLNSLFTLESHQSNNSPKMRVWYKAFVNETTTLDTFITFFSFEDVSIIEPPEIDEDDPNFITLNSGSGLRSIVEYDLTYLDSLPRNAIVKDANLILDFESSNLLEDENFRVVVAALQDSISDWNFISPTDEDFEYQSYSVNANFVVSQNQDNFQLKIPIEAFLQGYKNGLFTVDELLLYSANTNSPFDKVRLNLNSIEVLYVEP